MFSSIALLMNFWKLFSSGYIDLTHNLSNATLAHHPYTPSSLSSIITVNNHQNDDAAQYPEQNITNYKEAIIDVNYCGTRLDAPAHLGRQYWSIDQIPTNRFFGSVSVVDLRDKVKSNARHIIDIADFLRWEAKEGKKLDQLVLLWTGSPYYCHDREHHFPGLSSEVAEWLVTKRQIHGIGIDAPSIENGLKSSSKSRRILAQNNVFVIDNVNTERLITQRGYTVNLRKPFLSISPAAPVKSKSIQTGMIYSPVRLVLFPAAILHNN